MSESSLQNPEWPNRLQKDDEGYTVFYPLGTNKVDITAITWPDGDKLVSPFVYKNGKLAGFVDTKAMTVSGSATTTMNYSHIEANFAAISEGKLTVNAPNATVKKFTWSVNTGNSNEYVIIDFNTTDQEIINTVRTAKRVVDNKLYGADDNLIGTWDTSKIEVGGNDENGDGLFCNMEADFETERGLILSEFDSDLSSLINGTGMFIGCSNLTSFTPALPNLTSGMMMFGYCSNLTSFTSVLPNLTNGMMMFPYCSKLESFSSDLSNLTNGMMMFYECTNLATFTSDLSSLTNGSYMFATCSNLESFSSNLSNLTNSNYMFAFCENLTSFSSNLPSLTDGEQMFAYCSKLESFPSDLPNLTNGNGMFNACSALITFSSDLPNLTNGDAMFFNCTNLTTFSSELSNLTDGSSMFYATDLASFTFDLPSLTDGSSMFNGCTSLTTFTSDLSNLTNGSWMFGLCTNLTSFSSSLPSLTDGNYMFYGCKLDSQSVKKIIDTINTYSAKLTLGIGCNDTAADKDLFAQEVGYANMTSLLAALQDKGWTVSAQYMGRPTSTYSLRRPAEDTLPVFVKLEEVEEYPDYTSEDGSTKYRLDWFHETTGSTEGYTQFNSLEEAIEHFNIKPIERN